jgi:hypothetical protein
MKKFLISCSFASLLCILFFSCSNGDFKEPTIEGLDISGAKEIVTCVVEEVDGKHCYEISRSACDIMGGDEGENETCISFTCEWTPKEVTYGQKSTLSFNLDDKGKGDCSWKISYGDSVLYEGTALVYSNEYTISASTFLGLHYSKDTSIIAKAIVTCGGKEPYHQNCKSLEVNSVPGPEVTGNLSFKNFDYPDTLFFIGTNVDTSYINSTIAITNKEEAKCGDIEIRIEGSPAKLGTKVKATAVVNCEYTGELELASISADVLPDPVVGECELIGDWDAMMFKKDTLFMRVPIEHDYGRCKVQNDTLPLINYSGQVNDITAKVKCGTKTFDKKCEEQVFVADKFAEIKECHNPRVPVGPGITVVEITCLDGNTPAKIFGCDCSNGDWSATNMFTLNGVKAQGGGCWATASIPDDIASKESKRVLIEYNKEIGCVAY